MARVVPAVGIVAEQEFEAARRIIPALTGYSDYRDWLDAREGFALGLSAAGVERSLISVDLSSFAAWCGMTGEPCDETALDAFAAITLTVRRSGAWRAFAVLSAVDFRAYCAVAGLEPNSRRGWLRHRRTEKAAAARAACVVVETPVRIENFLDWCESLQQAPCDSSLDRYARLLLEALVG